MKLVKLFMKDGHLTKFCKMLSIAQRRRMFRACRVLSKRRYLQMLRNWSYDPTIELKKYNDTQSKQ